MKTSITELSHKLHTDETNLKLTMMTTLIKAKKDVRSVSLGIIDLENIAEIYEMVVAKKLKLADIALDTVKNILDIDDQPKISAPTLYLVGGQYDPNVITMR